MCYCLFFIHVDQPRITYVFFFHFSASTANLLGELLSACFFVIFLLVETKKRTSEQWRRRELKVAIEDPAQLYNMCFFFH